MSASDVVNATGEAAVESVNQFVKILKDFNVIGFALGVMIGNNAAELANSFIDGIIMPTLEPALASFRITRNQRNPRWEKFTISPQMTSSHKHKTTRY